MKFFNTAKIIIPIILLSYACTQHKKDNPIDSIKVETKDNSLLDKSKIEIFNFLAISVYFKPC